MLCPYRKKTIKTKNMYTEEVDTEEKFTQCQGKECPYFTKNETSGHCVKVDFEKAVMINSTRIIIKEE